MTLDVTVFQSRKAGLAESRFTHQSLSDPEPGQVVVRVAEFALTANNITYGVAGDTIGYWQFFPGEGEWGCIPVWGFGVVEQSTLTEVPVGARVYGYFPMATHVCLEPQNVQQHGFSDGASHRAELPPIYNQYLFTDADPLYQADREAEQMLYRPLFTTSFLLDDYLEDNDFFNADTIILTSASSKTSLGLAHLLHSRGEGRPRVVGLTSAGNVGFVEGLGCYDDVLAYENIDQLPITDSALVDMAGSGKVRRAVHERLEDALKVSTAVGATHWQDATVGAGDQALPGPAPAMFFAPSQAQKRIKELGQEGFNARLATAWRDFLVAAADWIDVERASGERALQTVYAAFISGQADPSKGYVLSL